MMIGKKRTANFVVTKLHSVQTGLRPIVLAMTVFIFFGISSRLPSPILSNAATQQQINRLFNRCGASALDHGDCQAIGPRRPLWDCPRRMRESLMEFREIYERRPFYRNHNGMRVEHSFALWYTLRSLLPTPTTVIENGLNHGHSTWLIKQSLPHVNVISFDPNVPNRTESGVEYFVGNNFTDFNKIDWHSRHLDPEKTVILFDDHQSSFRRVLKEGYQFGFKKFMIDDNYDLNEGDNYSLKQACERKRKKEWSGEVWDNFRQVTTRMTWEEHLKNGVELNKHIQTYYEFPPIAPLGIFTERGTPNGKNHRSTPLFSKKEDIMELKIGDGHEFAWYTHFTYVQIE